MEIKTRQDLINKYIEFFKSEKHYHIPSASLIPENDPTVLFTTAGMHPLVPFLLGQKHPLGNRLVDVQKCIRTQDIDEVGDLFHHTFFEMLGNWSLGDYFKEEAIKFSFEFLTETLGIPLNRLAITCFAGDSDAQKDEESAKVWLSLGIPKSRIAFLPKKNNWWGPAGETGPCGPDTEMFFWSPDKPAPKVFNPEDENWVEIWNDVFMQYHKDKRIIIVDGMYCLYDKDFNLNRELLNVINRFNSHNLLVVNKFREKGCDLVKNYDLTKDTNWEAFSLEENDIKKENPEYFKILLKKFGLIPEEVIYFDHDEKNVEIAKNIGILSKHYDNVKSIKKFIEDNLHAFIPLKQKNVDTGMGVERTLAALNGLQDNYQTSIFQPIIKEIEILSKKKYGSEEQTTRAMRIVADHIRAATFILGDIRAIKPSNVGQGYILRRLIRRAIKYGRILGISNFTSKIAKSVLPVYPDYQELHMNHKFIAEQLDEEETKFNSTLEKGLKKFNEIVQELKSIIPGKEAFLLFQSYGFPIEMTEELAEERGLNVDLEEYNSEFQKHQDLSRTASAGVFKSGLADNSEAVKKLHTATHLLNESLRQILDKNIRQKGSNITPERLRFDFNFPRKLTAEEIKKVEEWVNDKIKASLPVKREEVPLQDALSSGAQSEFGAKYPELVSVYTIEDKRDKRGWLSKELCTGPHAGNTSELDHFKITKEEAVAAGVRRIKAEIRDESD